MESPSVLRDEEAALEHPVTDDMEGREDEENAAFLAYWHALENEEEEGFLAGANVHNPPDNNNIAQPPIDPDDITNPQIRRLAVLKFWSKINLFLILYLIPMVVSMLIVTILDWNKSCEENLQLWMLVQNHLQVMLLGVSLVVFIRLPSPAAPDAVIEESFRKLYVFYSAQRIIDVFWFAWFVVGLVWTLRASGKDCPTTAPNMFNMSLAAVVIQTVIFSLSLFVCCCSCCLLSLRAVLGPALRQMPPGAPRGASKRLINSLALKKFSDDLDIDRDHQSCAICLSEYEKGESIRFLPCNHHFHAECIDKWLKTNKSCPFCKKCVDDPSFRDSSPV